GDDFQGFQEELLRDQPEAPLYFAMMKKLNKQNRPLLSAVPKHENYSVKQVQDMENITLFDTRDKQEFAQGHLEGSINIQHKNSLANWAGWMLNYEDNIVVIAQEGQQEEITRKLMRIGMDNIVGFVTNLQE